MSPNKLLLRFAKKYPAWIVLTVVLGFSGALFNGVSTTLIVPVLLNFLGQEVSFEGAPPIIQAITSSFSGIDENYRSLVMAGAILLAIVLKNVATYANGLTAASLARALASSMRQEGLRLLLEVDQDFYSKSRVGDIINRLDRETGRTASAIRTAIQIGTNIITILVFTGLLVTISWQLTLAATGFLLLVGLVNQYSINRSKQFGKDLSVVSREYSVSVLDVISGIRLVKSRGNEEREYERIRALIRAREKAEFQSQANSSAIPPVNEVAGIIALLAIVALGGRLFSGQIESLSAVLLTYLFILFRLLPIVGQLNNARSAFANTSASVEIVNDFMQRDNKPFMANGSIPYTRLEKGIAFKQVSFGYPGQEKPVLEDVDLWLPRGTTLALVGASGAGKSTLADLLPRFYDPTSGEITIDGIDLRDYEVRSVRRAIGIVNQDTFLFNDSVRNNIAYGWENSTDTEVFEAAKRANAYDFIMQLPQGFDTPIGDRGVLLSGGQRQRIAIARALLQNPEILILDEATSALDTVSERLVQAAIDNLSQNRTMLVIAHRLSTVQKAHQIAVMERGRVVEIGTHEELLQKGGYYMRLYSMQFSDGPQDCINPEQYQTLTKASYEIRTHLNSMIGPLKLLVDGLVDNSEERNELVNEAYYSTNHLLETLETLENAASTKAK
ncbi:ATP-binding cassette domain-containing protein [Leptolyngbya sp. FACHB-261]|uniref:ATP-binding cassette domain-containing protein n=1 Tax=Leptolyngbya sp. FACHB-261 TaxID=2692806 RepID=UPI0016834390|nr:ATP-binding cassette domain-containing protein [Leptolyngbya sp. FACHB-261]MBD2099522.1 ATP-binding cassette domain-containing protein [Leptolyngbya sp. FACHB-261]